MVRTLKHYALYLFVDVVAGCRIVGSKKRPGLTVDEVELGTCCGAVL
jgi:hypothetical protein